MPLRSTRPVPGERKMSETHVSDIFFHLNVIFFSR